MIPVYKFIDADGETVGCGTEAELAHWTAEGVLTGVRLGERVA